MSLPKPYYSEAGITIYHGDCREIVPHLGRFDLLLTDPPYGIGADANAHKNGVKCRANGFREYPETSWDDAPADDVCIDIVRAVADYQVIWGGNYFRLPPTAAWLIWDKGQRDFSFADGELAWTSFEMALRIKTFHRTKLLTESGFHPTQKPLDLMLWSVGFAPAAQSILDPFMGSGTTLRAAKDLGRKAVGIEIDEQYCEIAARRMSQSVLAL